MVICFMKIDYMRRVCSMYGGYNSNRVKYSFTFVMKLSQAHATRDHVHFWHILDDRRESLCKILARDADISLNAVKSSWKNKRGESIIELRKKDDIHVLIVDKDLSVCVKSDINAVKI